VRQIGGVVEHLRLPDVASVSKECEVCHGPLITLKWSDASVRSPGLLYEASQ